VARKGGVDRGLFERDKGSGVWWVCYFDANHRKHRQKIGNKTLARKVYMKYQTEIAEGRHFPNAHRRAPIFANLLTEYRDAQEREGKHVMKSDIGYRRVQERFGGRRAETITAAEVERWRDELRKQLAPATVNLHLTLLAAVLHRAVRNRKLDPSAVPAIRKLKTNNARLRYLTDEEEGRLLEALPDSFRPLITVAIHTGMRKGELLNLSWDEVDFVSGTIFVRTSKSGEGRRLPMSPTAHRTLAALWQSRRKRLSARVVNQSAGTRLVFANGCGGFEGNLGRIWYPALERAGLEGFHFHDLRHTFASRLAMQGNDLYRVQTLMGHKTQAMTLRYAHLSPQHLRAAVVTLDAPGPKPWAAKAQLASADSGTVPVSV
jgi:integrase